jgi:hypothetical protein
MRNKLKQTNPPFGSGNRGLPVGAGEAGPVKKLHWFKYGFALTSLFKHNVCATYMKPPRCGGAACRGGCFGNPDNKVASPVLSDIAADDMLSKQAR